MTLAPDTDNLVIGRGALYFDREDADGNPTGELDLGNAPDFPLKYAATIKEHFSMRRGVRSRDLVRVDEEKFSLNVTLDEYSKENLILAICGDKVEYLTQTSGADTASIKVTRGRWIDLGKRAISNVIVSHGATIFTYITDYLLDLPGGRVMPLSTGAIYENEDLFVSFDCAAISQPVLRASQREVFGMLRFVPDNAVGPGWELKAWRVQLRLAEDIQFIADDWGKIKLTAEVHSDEARHPTEPYFLLISQVQEAAPSTPPVPILYWKADDSTAEEYHGLDGVGYGSFGYVAGYLNNAFSFSSPGTSGIVDVAHDALINFAPTGKFSISIYIKPYSLSGAGYRGIIIKGGFSWCWGIWTTDNDRLLIGTAGHNLQSNNVNFTLNVWHRIFYSYNNGTHRLWWDDVEVLGFAGLPFPVQLITQNLVGLSFGARYASSYSPLNVDSRFDGAIDEIKIYDDAYTPSEVP